MTEIAAEAGISRQAIYQKHFNNFEDIIEYIHEETNQHIFNVFNKYCPAMMEILSAFSRPYTSAHITKREIVNTFVHHHKSTHVGRNFCVNILRVGTKECQLPTEI